MSSKSLARQTSRPFAPLLSLWGTFFLFFICTAPAIAQAQELQLQLSRDWGFGGNNGQIQGTFSYHVSGPDNLTRVHFLLDGETIGEDNEPPFAWQFETGNYPDGLHTFSAVGFTADNQELHSNEFQRVFLSGEAANEAVQETILSVMWRVVLPIILVVIGVNVLVYWISRNKTGKPAISGIWGGTICPKCGRPFALHWWKLNVGFSALDRCPHCRRWSRVNRVSESVLQAAAEALETKTAESPPDSAEKQHKRLEDSRFDN